MRRGICSVLAIALISSALLYVRAEEPKATERPSATARQDNIAVSFSPGGGCTDAIVGELNKAQKIIKIQAYSFTSSPIAKAIVEAKKRGEQGCT